MAYCPHCDETHGEGVDFCPRTGRPIVDVMDRMIGRTIAGKYRLVRSIGQGGMGTIFEAEHLMIGNKVAVKLLHEPFAEKREPVQRLYREAKATGAIGHPNIIKVHDVGETSDGVPFLVMELLEGESLGARIDREGPQPLGFVLDTAAEILSALHAAHTAGIIHRDLKSDNVFLVPRADGGVHVKLLDFGISKFVSPEMENLKLTQTGSVLGTPYYMSPEQATGKKTLDQRIDIYSAGVIIYEMLLGTIPHTASNYNALLIEILTEDVKPFRWLRPDVPEDLERIVLKALARDRDRRWTTALDFTESLCSVRDRLTPSQLDAAPLLRRELAVADRDSKTMDIGDVSAQDLGGLPLEFETGARSTFRRLTRSAKGRIAVWVTGSFALLGAVALTITALMGRVSQDIDPEDRGVAVEVAAPVEVEPAPDRSVDAGDEVDTVRLVVARTPAGAVVTVDGLEVPPDGLEIARTGIAMKLEAKADGYLPKTLDVVPTVDLDLEIVLDPASTKSDQKKKPRRGEVGKGGVVQTAEAVSKTDRRPDGKKPAGDKATLDRPMDNPF